MMHNGPSGVLSSCDLHLPSDDDYSMVNQHQSDSDLYLHHHHHHHHSDSSSTCSSSLSPKLTSSSPTAAQTNSSTSAAVLNSTGLNDIDPQLAKDVEYELGLTKKNGNGSGTRKNAWGNLSYAELISKAITSSAEKRLTLAEIYDWMIKYVPFFRNKVDRVSSAGWKNSIRHNLSLHNRFKRVQSEGTGKSSWWMINPDDKTVNSNGSSPSHSGTKHVRRRVGHHAKASSSSTLSSTSTATKRSRTARSSKALASRTLTAQPVTEQQQKSNTSSAIPPRDIPVSLYDDQSSWVNQSENDLTTNPLYEQGLYSTSVNSAVPTTSTANGTGGCLPSTYSYDDVTSNYISNSSNPNPNTGDYSYHHSHHFHSHHPQTLYQHHHGSTYNLNASNGYYQPNPTQGTSVNTDPSTNVNCSLSLDTYHPTNPSSYSLSQTNQQSQTQVTDPNDDHLFLRVHSSSSHSPNASLSPPTNANLVTASSSSGSTHKPSSSSSSAPSGGYLHSASNGTLTLYSHHHPQSHLPHHSLSHSTDMDTFLQLDGDTDDLDDDALSTLVHHPGLIDEPSMNSFYSNVTHQQQQHHPSHSHAQQQLHHPHSHPHHPHLSHSNTQNQNHSLFSHHNTPTSFLRTVLNRTMIDMHNQQV